MTTKELINGMNHKLKFLSYLILQLFVSFSLPWLNQSIIDNVLIAQQGSPIFSISMAYIILALISIFLHIGLPKVTVQIKEEVNQKLRVQLLKSIQENEVNEYPNSDKGNILTLFESDINRMSDFLVRGLKDIVIQTLSLVITIITLLLINWQIGLLSIMVIPIYLLLPYFFKKKLVGTNQRTQKKLSKMNTLVQEILSGIVQIRIFNKQTDFLERFQGVSDEVIIQKVKEVVLQKLASATIIIYWIVMFSVLWIGGTQVLQGELTIGILLILINYVDRIEWPVARLAECYSEYQYFIVSKKRWEKVVLQTTNESKQEKKIIEKIRTITFEGLSFAYRETTGNIFQKVTLNFKENDMVGIIGESGEGKSTFLKLLFGFEEPTEGNIYVNGIRLTTIDHKSYRQRIGYLSQESYLFEMSLLANISFGSDEKVSEEAVYLAAKQAGAHSFIQTFEKGYQSIYGKEGM